MHELMLLLAAKMPLDLLLTLLEKAVKEVRENPDDAEKISHLTSVCMLFGSREYVKGHKNGDVMDAIKDMNTSFKGIELLKTTKG